MESLLQQLFEWLPGGGAYYALLFIIAFLESVVGLGLLIPGSVLTVFAGFLSFHGKGDIGLIIGAATTGAFLGDFLSYWIGARIGTRLLHTRAFVKKLDLVRKAELFFASHGGKSVFFGRFLGPLRGFTPFVAGGAQMCSLNFIGYTFIASILWGLAYPGLGFVGGASWQKVQALTGRFSLLILALLALFILNSLFWKKLAPRLSRTFISLWSHLFKSWQLFLNTHVMRTFIGKHPRLWLFLTERFNPRISSGLYLTVGFAFSTFFALLFIMTSRAIHFHEKLFRLDQWAYEAVKVLHHPITDTFFLIITYLGSGQVILMAGCLVLLWLVLNNRDFSAFIFLAGVGGGELLTFILKEIFQRPRPQTYFTELQTLSASFPSAHAFGALVFYGLLVYMFLDTIKNWEARFKLILSGSFFALLIGFSRVYLGVHWLSDVLGGFAWAAVWLTFLVTASEIRRRYAGEFPWRTGWRPIKLTRKTRSIILTLAAILFAGGITFYILIQFAET